ncbi:MAG: phosphatase PAP2 family protein [Ferruginibacter sp.]|nr:phosphatase PAP2 family protein [Ferruginibacter sp.]
MKLWFLFIFFLFPLFLHAQSEELVLQDSTESTIPVSDTMVYTKPKHFSFITNIPKDLAGFTKQSFKKKNLKDLAFIAGTSAVLILADQMITNTFQSNLRDAGFDATESYSPILQIKIGSKKTNIGKLPHNINTAFYNLGQGSATMLFAAGFFLIGKIKHDNRALQTASQLTEAFITMGLITQLIKYSTGRENPSDATRTGGRWQPFPSWRNFQNHKTRYDAFPSGHLATFTSTVTIIGENYPEIKWIKPVGYTITGLIGLAMINNGVHWAGDFPLGIALGYGFGKFITKKTGLKIVISPY